MAYEKFICKIDESTTIAIKYNQLKRFCIIGGNSRFRNVMENIITSFYKQEIPRLQWIGKNKVRYKFSINIGSWDKGNKDIKDNFYLEQVVSLGTIMR